MAETIAFTSYTPRFAIPLLFAGQAQKEFFFNEAQLLIDALLHLSVEGLASSPPADATSGQCWIVEASAQSEWLGMEDSIALSAENSWKFITPSDGMTAFDRSIGQVHIFDGGWRSAIEPAKPLGGTNIDSEARSAITALIIAMKEQGVFGRS